MQVSFLHVRQTRNFGSLLHYEYDTRIEVYEYKPSTVNRHRIHLESASLGRQ